MDSDEVAHYEPSHLDLCCWQNPLFSVLELKPILSWNLVKGS